MAVLDEISKERQRVSRASMRSGKSSPASSASWRRPSVCLRDTARARRQGRRPQPGRRPRRRRRPLQPDHPGARALPLRRQLSARPARRASPIRFWRWQPAKRSRKSPLRARELARTMSAPPSRATSGLAASKSATASSTARTRQRRSDTPRSDTEASICCRCVLQQSPQPACGIGGALRCSSPL